MDFVVNLVRAVVGVEAEGEFDTAQFAFFKWDHTV